MKTSEHHSKPHQRTRETQTDFSDLSLLEKLKQKDYQILKLQKELQNFKRRNQSLNPELANTQSYTPSNPTSKDFAEVKHSRLFNQSELAQKQRIINKLPVKIPFDTANIEELDCFNPKMGSSFDTSDPVPIKAFPRKKSSERPNSRIPYSKNSKTTLKAKQRLNKNSSIISELVYQDGQDMETWKNLLNKFREDPNLIKQALDFKEELSRNSASVEPAQMRSRVASAYRTRKLSQEMPSDYRPLSAIKVNCRPITAKNREIDWSKSVLDKLVARGNPEFILGEKFLSNSQIEEILMNKNFENLDWVFEKGSKTLEKLKNELLLPKTFMVINEKSHVSMERILMNCSSLFRARA